MVRVRRLRRRPPMAAPNRDQDQRRRSLPARAAGDRPLPDHDRSAGFKRAVSERIDIHAGARARFDVDARTWRMTETISVRQRSRPAPDRELFADADIGADQIGQLPVNGRNFAQLAMLVGGRAAGVRSRHRESGFNAHGQWAVQNNFILDGVDNNSHIMGVQDRKAQVLVPNLDAVQEFQVQTSNYTAEFGRGAGAVMNVSIKSGTNAMHGTVHEFLRNDTFDARDAFDYFDRTGDGKADPNALRQNQFGFTVGGPVRKNRTFYFGSVEVTSIHSMENRLSTVPTALGAAGHLRYGCRDRPRSGHRPCLSGQQRSRANDGIRWRRAWSSSGRHRTSAGRRGRITHASPRAGAAARPVRCARRSHVLDARPDVRPRQLDGLRGERKGRFRAPASAEATMTSRATTTRVQRRRVGDPCLWFVGRSRSAARHQQPDGRTSSRSAAGFRTRISDCTSTAPSQSRDWRDLNFAGVLPYAPLGEFQFNPNDKTAGTLQFLENLSIAKGIAYDQGVARDLRWIRSECVGAQFARGLFNFNGRFTGSSFADFLLGMTSSRQFSTIQRGDLRERDYMCYVQDDWRAVPRLTVNLGLRYELASPKFDMQDRMSALDSSAFPERSRDPGRGQRPVVVRSRPRSGPTRTTGRRGWGWPFSLVLSGRSEPLPGCSTACRRASAQPCTS